MRLQTTPIDTHRLRNLLGSGSLETAAEMVAMLSPIELADILIRLGSTELSRLAPFVGPDRLGAAIAELDPIEAAQLILRFEPGTAADILEVMAPDDATDVVDELPLPEAERILAQMDQDEADDIRDLLVYPPGSAGGRMTTEFISIEPEITVATALRLIRTRAAHVETIYAIYVTDRASQLIGVVSLRDLVLADPRERVGTIARHQVIRVPADADQEAAAQLLTEHDLLALPVVDAAGRLLGIITADDVADVLEAEATEDAERQGGSEPLDVPYLHASIFRLARKRIVWLLVLFLAAGYTSSVIQHYEATLNAMVALTFFIPLLIGTGGNVGSQITTTLVRAMAVGDVRLRDLPLVLRKELGVGFLLGAALAVAMFVRASTLGVEAPVQTAVALSAVCVVVWAATVASTLPLALKRLGVDPALVSAPLITTLVDGTGLIIYFTIADQLMGL